MKIKNITNIKKFFSIVNECKGTVELITEDGDRLNLKSKLCQYISLSSIFKHPEIGEIEIMFSDVEDIPKMIDFLVRG